MIGGSVSHAARLTSIAVDYVDVAAAGLGAVEGNPPAVRRPARASEGRAADVGQLNGIAALAITSPELVVSRSVRRKNDLLAIGRELWFQIRLRGGNESGGHACSVRRIYGWNAPDIEIKHIAFVDQPAAAA